MRAFIGLFTSLLIVSCVGRQNWAYNGVSRLSPSSPVVEDMTTSDIVIDGEFTLVLDYEDANLDEADSCTTSSPVNVTVTSPCACSGGVCSVGIKGTSTGAASIEYTVTANGDESNTAVLDFDVTTVAFVSTWRMGDAAYGDASTILTIEPNTDAGMTYNYDIDWGDGSPVESHATNAPVNHDYGVTGTFTVSISGQFEGMEETWDSVNRDKLLSVSELGSVGWKTFRQLFRNCDNLTTVSGGYSSNVTTMAYMFDNAPNALPDGSTWDTSNVESMAFMFRDATSANPNTSNWDLGNVTSVYSMFDNAASADPDTSSWDVSSVETWFNMFADAVSANPDTSNWNVSSAEMMEGMFNGATSANPDMSGWDFSGLDTGNDSLLGFGNGSNISDENYNALLIQLDTTAPSFGGVLDVPHAVPTDAAGTAARTSLLGKLWAIDDGL